MIMKIKIKPLIWETNKDIGIKAKTTNKQYLCINTLKDEYVVYLVDDLDEYIDELDRVDSLKKAQEICEEFHRFSVGSSIEFMEFKDV